MCECEMSADSLSDVLVEEESLELNLEQLVLDSGQETRAGAVQLWVCKTSARRETSLSDSTSALNIY